MFFGESFGNNVNPGSVGPNNPVSGRRGSRMPARRVLLALCLLLTVEGGAMIRYTEAAARTLHDSASYIQGVLGAGYPGADVR